MSIRAMIVAALVMSLWLPAASLGQDNQQPAAQPPARSTPPTFPSPDPKQIPDEQASDTRLSTDHGERVFMGTVVRQKDTYVLRAANLEYRLDDSSKVKAFTGKNVKITGKLDQASHTLHVEAIEVSPSM